MTKYLISILLLALSLTLKAQTNYDALYNQGLKQQREEQYYPAIQSYSAAIGFTTDKVKIDKAKTRIGECADKLNKLKIEALQAKNKAEEQTKIAEQEKQKAQAALENAAKMQQKAETAMFDRAVKERNVEWKGYSGYAQSEREQILNEITYLNFSGYALLRLPREVIECKNLKNINLLQNPDFTKIQWDSCFQILSKLPLSEIWVSIYDLDSIPQNYWSHVTGIELLQSNGHKIRTIPTNIIAQKQLRWFKINADQFLNNDLKQLPTGLCELTNLQYLELIYAGIDSLPKEFGNLKMLEELKLSNNSLTTIPSEIKQLTKLQYLSLDHNQLNNLPSEIGDLCKLKSLNLNYNHLIVLPTEIGKLKNLNTLSLQWNKLITLPVEIGNLGIIQILDLRNNNLTDIPVEIGNLLWLEKIYLSGNKDLKTEIISNAFANYSKIFHLTVEENFYNEKFDGLYIIIDRHNFIPSEIGRLKMLKSLNLNNCKLTIFPSEICNLKKLTSINLQGNQLISLPKEIIKLKNLKELNIRNNPIFYLPNFSRKLSKRINLFADYSDNEYFDLDNSVYLDLSNRHLIKIPPEIGNLKQIETLILENNQLKTLPPEIGNLNQLEKLDLRNNQLSCLPIECGNLMKLHTLLLAGNDLTIINSICETFSNFPKKIRIHGTPYSSSDENVLNIQFSSLKNISLEISNLINLTSIDIEGNELEYLCNALVNYSKFVHLSTDINAENSNENVLLVRVHNLRKFPSNIGKIDKLQYVYLKGDIDIHLDSICCAFQYLPKKIHLTTRKIPIDFDENVLIIEIAKLKNVLAEFCNLPNLTGIDLSENDLTSLPSAILKCTNLTNLCLNSNKLTTLPSEINNLTYLTTLSLENNKLTSIPVEIEKLYNLKKLSLDNNLLMTLPYQIGNLKNLTTLTLSNNKLTSIPTEIFQLTDLKKFELGGNRFVKFPNGLGKLSKLQVLGLNGINYTAIKNEIVQLTSLQELDLSNSLILNLPSEILQLANLEKLNIGLNLISTLPSELSRLNKLQNLVISGNRISTFPNVIFNLPQLNSLDIGLNMITSLPVKMKKIKKLYIDIDRNPLSVNSYNLVTWMMYKGYWKLPVLQNKPVNIYLEINWASSLIFQNEYQQAEEILLKFKDKKMNEMETGAQFVLHQLQRMEDAGFIPPQYMEDVEKIRKLMKE
jgi:Leucine-rich repeat (LRR) protein